VQNTGVEHPKGKESSAIPDQADGVAASPHRMTSAETSEGMECRSDGAVDGASCGGLRNAEIAAMLKRPLEQVEREISKLIHAGTIASRHGLLWSHPDSYVQGRGRTRVDVAADVGRLYMNGARDADVSRLQYPQRIAVVLGLLDRVLTIGVAVLLGSDARLRVIECGPAERALEATLAQRRPQVAVVGETTEPAVVEHLGLICPQTRLLVLAHDPSHDRGMQLLAAGANCVSRCAPELHLGAVVHRTARGDRFLALANGAWVERRYPAGAESLTDREREVLVYLTKDVSYAEIACALRISYRTVQTYVPRIMRKLGVRDRGELVGMPVPAGCTEVWTLTARPGY
jgi:DNA-binding NarL/FixJ family response regulator